MIIETKVIEFLNFRIFFREYVSYFKQLIKAREIQAQKLIAKRNDKKEKLMNLVLKRVGNKNVNHSIIYI